MSWSLRNKKERTFCNVYFVRRRFFEDLRFISMYSVMNTLSEYTYFCKSESITCTLLLIVFKIVESLQIRRKPEKNICDNKTFWKIVKPILSKKKLSPTKE